MNTIIYEILTVATQHSRNSLHRGQELKEVLVLDKNEAQQKLILSLKPTLIEAVKQETLPTSKSEFKKGTVIPVRPFLLRKANQRSF